jgi:RNA-directed DNA polymerase
MGSGLMGSDELETSKWYFQVVLTLLIRDKHPDKTFIGKIAKGFDFLGYHFSPHGLRIANITWSKFEARLYRLYEQKKASADCDAVLGEYVRRWVQWANAGIDTGSLS